MRSPPTDRIAWLPCAMLFLIAGACTGEAPQAMQSQTTIAAPTTVPPSPPHAERATTPVNQSPPECAVSASPAAKERVVVSSPQSGELGLCVSWVDEPGADSYRVAFDFNALTYSVEYSTEAGARSFLLDDSVNGLIDFEDCFKTREITVQVSRVTTGQSDRVVGGVSVNKECR